MFWKYRAFIPLSFLRPRTYNIEKCLPPKYSGLCKQVTRCSLCAYIFLLLLLAWFTCKMHPSCPILHLLTTLTVHHSSNNVSFFLSSYLSYLHFHLHYDFYVVWAKTRFKGGHHMYLSLLDEHNCCGEAVSLLFKNNYNIITPITYSLKVGQKIIWTNFN